MSTTEATVERIRQKYSQDLQRLANYIKSGNKKSELLLICNVSNPSFNTLMKAIVEMMFEEMAKPENQP